MKDSEGQALDPVEAVRRIVALVKAQRSAEGFELLRNLATLNPKVENFHFLRALFFRNSVVSFPAVEAVRNELELFPNNGAARNYLQELEHERQERIQQAVHLPKDILISLVMVSSRDLKADMRVVQAALYQLYPTIEIVVVQRESDPHHRQALSVIDPRVRLLESFGATFWQALEFGLQSAQGQYQMLVPNCSVVFADCGLQSLAYLVNQVQECELLVGQRIYLDELRVARPMRHDYLQYSRASLLEEQNFQAPSALPNFTQVVWSTRLFQKAGNRLATDLREAVDFELFARFLRHSQVTAVPITLGGGSIVVDADSEKYSLRYMNEALMIMRREKREKPISFDDTQPGPRISFGPASEGEQANGQKKVRSAKSLPATYDQLVRERGPTITLVMPSFNQAQFLEQAIDSILSQGYPHLEFIIIDGGSTDGSVDIIKRYDRYLTHWCSQKDDGHYFAVQKGFDLSRGEVMGWLNSDDKLAPQALSWLGLVFLAFPAIRWVTGCSGTIHESGLETSEPSAHLYSRASYLSEGYHDPFIQQEGTFWRRSLWEEAGGALDLRYSLAADMELWRRFFRFSQLCSVDFTLGLFRVQPQQRSQIARAEYDREAESAMREELYLIQKGIYPEMLPALELLTEEMIIQAAERVSISR